MPSPLQSPEYRTAVEVLIDARKRANLTQQEVADRMGKPQSFVAKTERGERRLDVVEFAKLAHALDVDPRRLFDKVLRAME
ncbi:MAG: helix-turn-helix transcriptional regulator [Pseudomonadota bacterium]